MNELECIRAFVKVAEVGSFAEASRQSGTVKSVMTKRVNQLESHLELQLLQRSTRKLTLTDGGADFYERAVLVLAQLEQAKAAVSSVEWSLSGTLTVSCISSFAALYLAKDLCEFQVEHPDLTVELQQHDRFCDPVQEGFDVCLQIDRPTISPGTELDTMPIANLSRTFVASAAYIKKYGNPNTLDDLKDHKHVLNNYINPDYCLHFVNPKGTPPVKIKPLILTNTIWMAHAAITSNEYIGLLPIFFIEKELIAGKLVPILPQYRTSQPTLSAYYSRSAFVPMKVRIFVNFLRRKYGSCPPWEDRIREKQPELAAELGFESQLP